MLNVFRNDSPTKWTDEALLARYVADGDMRYLGILYERYMPMVYGVCLKVLRDSGKSEDAVMAIFEELTVKARAHDITAFRGWLYVLARNHCLMLWRKEQRQPTDMKAPEDMDFFDAVEPPFEVELPQDEIKSLEKCMETLPDMQKQCVEMFYYKDKSYKEIAELLEEELGKIRSYIQNGRRNLKNCLEQFGLSNASGQAL
ncbi:MAG: sigma-70 family RNA polymerase sigma factor [Lewinellaceae bacterium]|nr:sigma-70 family RNA polymerase sigma factor [Lewinellaceae bacterium]